jgi:virginiamycin B lyase
LILTEDYFVRPTALAAVALTRTVVGNHAVPERDGEGREQATSLDGQSPPSMGAGAFLGHALWAPVFDTGKLLRIDTRTNRVTARFTYGHQETVNPQQNPNMATTVDGQLWVADRGGKAIVRIDPATNRVMRRVSVGIHVQNLAGIPGSLWASSYDDDTVVRVDLKTDTAVATLKKVGRPTDIAAGDGALWVAVKDAPHVIRIDPVSNKVVATISVGTDPQSLAVDTGVVWVNNGNGNELFRIDPASNRVVATIPLDRSAGVRTDQSCGCQSVAAGNGSTWALAHDEHQLVRVDPQTNRIVARLTIPTPHGASPLITWDVLMGEGLWIDAERYVIRINPRSA